MPNFNSHAHVERDQRQGRRFPQELYFNSHAHVERDRSYAWKVGQSAISTHTLTWSVTNCRCGLKAMQTFQLTRSRGAWRLSSEERIRAYGDFNSHAHVERDLHEVSDTITISCISTHTLTWSVTLLSKICLLISVFQLTRSRGAWPALFVRFFQCLVISTHTLTWSVTSRYRSKQSHSGFQLTRSRGAWPEKAENSEKPHANFNSHAHVERDLDKYVDFLLFKNFNSHAHVERDRAKGQLVISSDFVNNTWHIFLERF